MTTQQRIGFYLIPLVLAVYVLPFWVALYGLLDGQIGRVSALDDWFVDVLVGSPGSGLSIVRELLLPITAGVTVAAMWSRRDQWWTIAVAVLCILSLGVVGVLWNMLSGDQTSGNIIQSAHHSAFASVGAFTIAATQLLSATEQTLVTYLLILLGLQQIPTKQE